MPAPTPQDVVDEIVRRLKAGQKPRAIGDAMGLKSQLVRHYGAKHGFTFGADRADKWRSNRAAAHAMLAKGASARSVQRALGLHWNVVAAVRREMGQTWEPRSAKAPPPPKPAIEVPRWVRPQYVKDYILAAEAEDEFEAAAWVRQQQNQQQAA